MLAAAPRPETLARAIQSPTRPFPHAQRVHAVVVAAVSRLVRGDVARPAPNEFEPMEVEEALRALLGVAHIHDLHITPLSTTEIALTCHPMVPGGAPGDAFLHNAADMFRERFGIV